MILWDDRRTNDNNYCSYGLIITVIINISRFAGAVTKIETSLNHLNDVLKELKEEFKDSREEMAMKRKRLWEHNEKQDKILDEHELRIIKLENKEGH